MREDALPYAECMALDIRSLRVLVACADAGTITDAALAVGLSQAAASRTIASLERELGAQLLVRRPRGVELTALGIAVVAQARKVLTELDAVRALADGHTSPLRVGYAWAAFGEHTDELRRQWGVTHPARRLELMNVNSRTAGLAENLVDVAVLRVEADDRFETASIGSERRFAAVPSGDPLARRRTLTLDDLVGHVVVGNPEWSTTTAALWPEGAVTMRRIWGTEEWLDEIATGGAVGTTAEATVARHPRRGVTYRPLTGAPRIPVTLAWRRGEAGPEVEALVGLARELYGRDTEG